MSNNPIVGTATAVVTGGTAINAAPANVNGGYITNPLAPIDQNLVTAEPLLIDPTGAASLSANTTTIALKPGDTYFLIPNSTKPVSVNAATSGHQFTCVVY